MTIPLPTGLTWRTSSFSSDNGMCVEIANLPAVWRTSSFSTDNGACVEIANVPVAWRTSSRSTDNGMCVEIADLAADLVAVRDSKRPDAGHLVVPRHALLALVR